MKVDGVGSMLLFVKWCNKKWFSKLGSIATLIKSEELKKSHKICKPNPNP